MRFQALRVAAVGVFDFAAALAVLRAKMIAQDGEQPGRHICARLKRVDVGKRAQQRFLHEVVRAVDVAAQRNRKRAQARDGARTE